MFGQDLTDQQLLTALALATLTLAAATWVQLTLPRIALLSQAVWLVTPRIAMVVWRYYDTGRRRRRGRRGAGVRPADIAAIVSRENAFMAAWHCGPQSARVAPPPVCYRIARPWAGTWSGRWPTHG